jgi:hypothetical protein
MVDFAHADYEFSTSMMTAIKCQADRAGERGAPPEWVWEFWQMDWTFRQGHEVWGKSVYQEEFHLPASLSLHHQNVPSLRFLLY